MSKGSVILSRWRMMTGAVLTFVALSGSASAQELTKVSLRLKWLASSQFIGYYVAKDKGWYAEAGLDLTINPGGPNIIGENLVAAGTDTFGHAGGAASLLQARSKGLPLVGIAMMFQQTPYRFIARASSGIHSLEDFKGKAVSTWFTGPQFLLQGLLRSKNIPLDEVHIQAQSASIVPFIEGQVQVATATTYDELPVLKREGVTDLVIFNPAEMGVNLPNEVIIVSETYRQSNPKTVQSFLDASLRGWAYALQNPEEAVDILMKSLPGGSRVHQADEMRELPALVTYGRGSTEGIGYIDMRALEFTNKFLVDNGVIAKPVDVPSAVDLSFWQNVPAEFKRVPQSH
jgi:NitT/TauT family transport system substrate-binding protein